MLRVVLTTVLVAACGSSSPKPAPPPADPPPPAPPPREQVYVGPTTPPTLSAGFHFDVVEERTDRWGEDEAKSSTAAWRVEFTKIDPPQVITFRFRKMQEIWDTLSNKTIVLTLTDAGPTLTDENGAAVPTPNYAFSAFLNNGTLTFPELYGQRLDKDAPVTVDGPTLAMVAGYPLTDTSAATLTLQGVDPEGVATIAFTGEGSGADAAGNPITWTATGTAGIDVDTWLPTSSRLAYQTAGVYKAHGFDLHRTYAFE